VSLVIAAWLAEPWQADACEANVTTHFTSMAWDGGARRGLPGMVLATAGGGHSLGVPSSSTLSAATGRSG
jgi:hypothetical protein